MNAKLVTALRTTAKAIEDGTFHYDWDRARTCNCGALFCALTGVSANVLAPPPIPPGGDGTWKSRVGYHCPVTGTPENELFKELFSYGLTAKDIVNLEYLADERVVARMDPTKERTLSVEVETRWWQPRKFKRVTETVRVKPDHENKVHVIAYMRAWADLIAERDEMDTPERPDLKPDKNVVVPEYDRLAEAPPI